MNNEIRFIEGTEHLRGFREALLCIYVFMCAFLPPIMPVSTKWLVVIAGISYIVFAYVKHRDELKLNICIQPIKPFLPFVIYIIATSCAFTLLNANMGNLYLTNLWNAIEQILLASLMFTVFVIASKRLNLSTEDFRHILIKVGIAQTVCVLLCYFSPEVRHAFLSMTVENGYASQNVIASTQSVLVRGHRGYGLALNLFDSFGYVTSFMITAAIIRSMEADKKYLIAAIIMLCMPLLNARTGLLLVFVMLVIIAFAYGWNLLVKDILYSIIIVISAIVVVQLGSIMLTQDQSGWIFEGFGAIVSFLGSGEETGIMYGLTHMIGPPSNILLGEGASPEALGVGSTDVGYIQLLWQYGLLGAILLLLGFIYIFYKKYMMVHNYDDRIYVICESVIFFIYLLKLNSITNIGAIMIIFGYYGVVWFCGKCSTVPEKAVNCA